jgi:DNA-binding CsgD family transcriptional regulator
MSECGLAWFSSRFGLTSRQRDVFFLLVQGLSPKEIAHRLAISPVTVRRHGEEIYRRCGTSNQRETLALLARIVMLGRQADNDDLAAVRA